MQDSPLLVIDKSFAHALNAERLAALSIRYRFLIPSTFYYEVFDPESGKLLQTLTGLGEFRRVDLAALLWREAESGKPAAIPELPPLRVNAKVFSPDWKLSAAESAIIQQYRENLVEPLVSFWGCIRDKRVIGFSREELVVARESEKKFVKLCESLRDPGRIRMIATEFQFPHAAMLDEYWLQYRKFQTWVLQGLILWHRYQHSGGTLSVDRIEHDAHDTEYLMLGLHTGNLATCETSEKLSKASMGWRFKLLKPQGQLLTPESA